MLAPAQDNRRAKALWMLADWIGRRIGESVTIAISIARAPAYQDLALGSATAFISVMLLLRFWNVISFLPPIAPPLVIIIALGFVIFFLCVQGQNSSWWIDDQHPPRREPGRTGKILGAPLFLLLVSVTFILALVIFAVVSVYCITFIVECFAWVGEWTLLTWPKLVPAFTSSLGNEILKQKLANAHSLKNQTALADEQIKTAFEKAAKMATFDARITLGLGIVVLVVLVLLVFACLVYGVVIGCQTIRERYEAYYADAAPKSHSNSSSGAEDLGPLPRSGWRPSQQPIPHNPHFIPDMRPLKFDERKKMYYHGNSVDEIYSETC